MHIFYNVIINGFIDKRRIRIFLILSDLDINVVHSATNSHHNSESFEFFQVLDSNFRQL